MIVVAAFLIAFSLPPADLAVRCGFGIGRRTGAIRANDRRKARLYVAVIGRVIQDPVALRRKGFAGRYNMHCLGKQSLRRSEQMRVKRQLQDRCGFCFMCEFAVIDFIRPIAEYGRLIDLSQDIDASEPILVTKRCHQLHWAGEARQAVV